MKKQVLEAIPRLPDDIDFQDVTDGIALLAAVYQAERDIDQSRLISNGNKLLARLHRGGGEPAR